MSRTCGWIAAGMLCFAAIGAPADEKAYRAGVGLANKGANDAAVQELNRYLSADPEGANAVSARYTLGVCLARLGKYQEAAKALDAVVGVREFAFLNDARLLRAQCASATGDYAGASSVLKKLLKEAPQFEKADQAAMLYGESQYRLGRAAQARTALQNFGAKWPKSESLDRAELICALAELSLAETESAAGRLEALLKRSPNGACAGSAALALGQVRQGRGDLPGARAMYETAAKSGDAAVVFDAGLGAARIARAGGDLAGAENALRALDAAKASPDQAALIGLERGKVLLQQGKVDEAGTLFGDVATGGPEGLRPTAQFWMAKCDLKAGRADQAARELGRLADSGGASELLPEILFDRAVALSQSGDDAGAALVWQDWQKRFANNPLAAQASASQAACHYRLGQYEQSLALCQRVVERHRDYPRMSEVILLMGEGQFFLAQYAEANETYGQFIERFGNDPARGRIEIRRGLCLEKLGRREEAEQTLAKALESAGSDVEKSLRVSAYSSLGDMSVAKQDWAGAEKWFARAIEAGGAGGAEANADLLLRSGVASARQGNTAAALPTLEKAWKAASGTPIENHAAFEYANVLVQAGRTDEASERLTAIVQAEKKSGTPVLTSAALRQLAAMASTKGDAKGAAEALSRIDSNATTAEGSSALLEQAGAWLAAGEYAKAEQACNSYLETRAKGKGATVARARRAIAMNRQGKHEDAAREFAAVAGKSASLDAETLAAVRYETALALRSLGRDEEAAAAYRQLLEGSPSASVEAYASLDLAQIALGAKKTDEAMALIERCRGAAGKLSAAEAAKIGERETYVRALCLNASGKPAEAAKALEEFEKTYPSSDLLTSVRLTLGDALGQAGRARDAAAVLSRVANDPAVGANRGYALLKLGEVSANASLWEESEKAYTAFLDSESASALWFQARFGQGWARENQSKYDGACEAYRDVVDRHEGPTAARAQFQIGECLYAQKKLEEAIRELLKVDVLYGYPEWSAAALYEAGRCMKELGREKEAAAQFEEVMKRFPATRWAALAKENASTGSASAGLPSGGGGPEASAER
ncbi:MAG: tetratricopeptide repeat protein [Phycisphaerae bacterium]|nr:tetratricopeptide repeat protein [Phycisphaerae bacterium]